MGTILVLQKSLELKLVGLNLPEFWIFKTCRRVFLTQVPTSSQWMFLASAKFAEYVRGRMGFYETFQQLPKVTGSCL